MNSRMTTKSSAWIAALLCVAGLSFGAPPTASASPSPMAPLVKNHKHKWVTATKNKWIPPVVKRVAVGKDKNGKPIYKEKVVQKGRYKTVKVKRCKKCGKEG